MKKCLWVIEWQDDDDPEWEITEVFYTEEQSKWGKEYRERKYAELGGVYRIREYLPNE
jgi:hypothetical protein